MEENDFQIMKTKKQFLQRYNKTLKLIERLEAKLLALDDRLTSVGSPSISDLPRCSSGKTSSDLILDKIELQDRINRLILKAKEQKGEIIEAIDELDDRRVAEVLESIYIDGLDMYDISDQTGYSVRHVYRLYIQGLNNIELPQPMSVTCQ